MSFLSLYSHTSSANTIRQKLPVLVSSQVAHEVSLLHKTLGTEVALERSLTGVNANVHGQVALPTERFAAVVAFVQELAHVDCLVSLHVSAVTCTIGTHGTLPQLLCHRAAQLRRLVRAKTYSDQICASQIGAFAAKDVNSRLLQYVVHLL